MYNTPPCWAIYMCGLVFNHMLKNGGIEAMQKTNQAKAKVLYDAIDGSDGFYVNPIDKANRSNMNVPFTIPSSQELEAVFVKEAAAAGMVSTLCLHATMQAPLTLAYACTCRQGTLFIRLCISSLKYCVMGMQYVQYAAHACVSVHAVPAASQCCDFLHVLHAQLSLQFCFALF